MQRGKDARPARPGGINSPGRCATGAATPRVSAAVIETLERRQLLAAYFVSTTGDDNGPGTIEAPFKTVERGIEASDPGDVINLRGGTYAGGFYVAENDITIQSFPGERAHIATPINVPGRPVTIGFNTDADNVTLKDLDISGGYNYAIKLESDHDEDEPEGNYDGASGIVIENCRVHDSGQHVIKLSPECDDVVIRNTEIYNSGMRDPGDGQGIDAVNADNLVVEDCYIHDTTQNGLFVKGGSRNANIQRNRLENIGWSGILLGQATSWGFFDPVDNPERFESIDCIAIENTVINAGFSGIAVWGSLNARVQLNLIVNTAHLGQAGILLNVAEHYPDGVTQVNRPSRNVRVHENVVIQSNGKPLVQIREDAVEGFPHLSDNTYYRTNGPAEFWDERTIFKGPLEGWRALVNGERGSKIADPGLYTAAAPTAVASVASFSGVQISWADRNDRLQSGAGVHTYRVYRGATPDFTPGPESLVGTTTSTSFTDPAPVEGQNYYRITIDNGSGVQSRPSVAITPVTNAPVITDSLHRYLAGDNAILLTWQHVPRFVGEGITPLYHVYRGTTPDFVASAGNLIATTSELRLLDEPVGSADVYYYRVTAVEGDFETVASGALGEAGISDVNGDGQIDSDDQFIIDTHEVLATWQQDVLVDFNGDSAVDSDDQFIFDTHREDLAHRRLVDYNGDGLVNGVDAGLLEQVPLHWYGDAPPALAAGRADVTPTPVDVTPAPAPAPAAGAPEPSVPEVVTPPPTPPTPARARQVREHHKAKSHRREHVARAAARRPQAAVRTSGKLFQTPPAVTNPIDPQALPPKD